ncbi:MAG: ABC transporter ATP-binding protein, partial [Mesorhizobium sp.]
MWGMSQWIMWEMSGLFENIGTVQDGIQSISLPRLVEDRPGAKDIAVSHGEIRFDDIRFHYGKQKGVIENLSLTVKPGEKVGIVGRSGAGKSTLVNLLLRFYDLESGRILVDGQEIAAVTQDSLRAQIGMVTQDTSLLHRSVKENILYG